MAWDGANYLRLAAGLTVLSAVSVAVLNAVSANAEACFAAFVKLSLAAVLAAKPVFIAVTKTSEPAGAALETLSKVSTIDC